MNNIDNMNMSNININNSDDDEDEGYKRFLAFLASSPNHEEKAAAVAPPSMPMLTISRSEDHEISAAATSSWEEEGKKDTVDEFVSAGYIFEQSSDQLELERVHKRRCPSSQS
eukprot:scaffold6653_cov71-Skeletonema_dohrnii-CCMP3373.AAC.4